MRTDDVARLRELTDLLRKVGSVDECVETCERFHLTNYDFWTLDNSPRMFGGDYSEWHSWLRQARNTGAIFKLWEWR